MGYSPGSALLKEGYFRFVATFSWTDEGDAMALARFQRYFVSMKKEDWEDKYQIDQDTTHGYYLSGQRTFVVIGYAQRQVLLEKLVSNVIFGAPINAEVVHAVEGEELKEVFPELKQGT